MVQEFNVGGNSTGELRRYADRILVDGAGDVDLLVQHIQACLGTHTSSSNRPYDWGLAHARLEEKAALVVIGANVFDYGFVAEFRSGE